MRSRKHIRIKPKTLHETAQGIKINKPAPPPEPEIAPDLTLSYHLEKNLSYLHTVFDHADDIVYHPFRILDGRDAVLLFIDGLSDTKQIDTDILRPLTQPKESPSREGFRLSIDEIDNEYLLISGSKRIDLLQDAVKTVVEETGVVLLIDQETVGIALSVSGGKTRSIEEPNTESVVRGPREGFTESLSTSLTLIRRRLRTADFKVEMFGVGTYTKTKVAICYLDGIINPGIVEEVRTRIGRIETDGIIDSGYIEEFIEDTPVSPFPQIQNTERPDVVAASLLEGKIAIIVDGSPFALIAPVSFWSMMQASEDYYSRYMIANAIRILRYGFLFVNLYLPSLYVAITTFHQEMLPTKALLSIAAAREVTPFPAVIEALIMEITFEALREAGVRLPKTVGSAISIVGALVIGQAAVQAGIVSAPMVIVVSITGIGSFIIPRYNLAIALRMLRFPMILFAGALGLFGIVIATLVIVIHLSGLRSLGVPYLDPVSPFNRNNMKDIIVRVPHWAMQKRPRQTSKENLRRQTDATRPKNRVPARR